MKIENLPNKNIALSLMQYAFDDRQKNKSVYDFVNSLDKVYNFIDSEFQKVMQMDDLNDSERELKLGEVLKTELNKEDIVIHVLTSEDFDNCRMPKDKNCWLTEFDIQFLLNLKEEYHRN